MTSFNLNYLLEALAPSIVTSEVRASTYKFEVNIIQLSPYPPLRVSRKECSATDA